MAHHCCFNRHSAIHAIKTESSACISIVLNTDNGFYFVHGLQDSYKNLPGLIFINQRDTWKKGCSWETLGTVDDDSVPSLIWNSK